MSCFSDALKTNDVYVRLCDALCKPSPSVCIIGLSPVYKAHFIHAVTDALSGGALVITADEASASKLCSDINAFGSNAMLFPYKDLSFSSDATVSREYEHIRLGVLCRILSKKYDVIVAPAAAVCQKTIPPEKLSELTYDISFGNDVTEETLMSVLLRNGYARTEQVEGPGQFSIRGGITDFFPPDRTNPVRIELWGDTVDTVSEFDPSTQRRFGSLKHCSIPPANETVISDPEALSKKLMQTAARLRTEKSRKAKEKLEADAKAVSDGIRLGCADKYLDAVYDAPGLIFDYLPENTKIFVSESADVRTRCIADEKVRREDIKDALLTGDLCSGLTDFYIGFSQLTEEYKKHPVVFADDFARGTSDIPLKTLLSVNFPAVPLWSGSFEALKNDIMPEKDAGFTAVISVPSARAAAALSDDLARDGLSSTVFKKLPEHFPERSISIITGNFSGGVTYSAGRFMLISTASKAASKNPKRHFKKPENAFHSLDELHAGDYVVHTVHGIGIFRGVTNLTAGGVTKDYLKIEYAKGDTLFVPVTQLDLIAKYIGGNDESRNIKLSKIGSSEWKKTKSKVRAAVDDMAKELTELYAARMSVPGYAFGPDTDMQSDFERRFEFDETDDQLRCIYEIKKDMEKPYPMDRLLCGDVGFGKTEVALRAAFKCIAEGKQCALLVPTTILAFQHYQTVSKRFDGFPIEVAMMSRFVSSKEQKKYADALRRGSCDMVIGTHRILSSDIQFRDLGLLIIDEEQRFGVAQKEKIKAKFPNVDVLTLSATPIPRTLNMAMTGIRDMSVIEQAPADRYPVTSYVTEYDDDIIYSAIEKELRRAGQVYFMHNRVETIAARAAQLKEMFPDASVDIAHGQMTEQELSSAWKRLLLGQTDILVCTTIIETGVDVPNANTLIIENADALGLAQLHQIRGRIGRSSRRAFAYFTFVRGKQLSEIAQGRLEAIREYTEFGSGFKIAMRDLQLRGAGSILGSRQHGHLEAVGYDMYLHMLSQSIEALKKGGKPAAEDTSSDNECLIDIKIDAYIPESYISSVPGRLSMYRRIADVKNKDDASDVTDELIDRYGDPPECVLGLLQVALQRNIARAAGVYEIGQRNDTLLLYCDDVDINAVLSLNESRGGGVNVHAGVKPYISVRLSEGENELDVIKKVLTVFTAGKKSREKKNASK